MTTATRLKSEATQVLRPALPPGVGGEPLVDCLPHALAHRTQALVHTRIRPRIHFPELAVCGSRDHSVTLHRPLLCRGAGSTPRAGSSSESLASAGARSDNDEASSGASSDESWDQELEAGDDSDADADEGQMKGKPVSRSASSRASMRAASQAAGASARGRRPAKGASTRHRDVSPLDISRLSRALTKSPLPLARRIGRHG